MDFRSSRDQELAFLISTSWVRWFVATHAIFMVYPLLGLQGGLPTDRLVAEWYLDSPRVTGILDGRNATEQRANDHIKIEERILVSASIYEWKASPGGRGKALTVQLRIGTDLQNAFSPRFSRSRPLPGTRRVMDVFELGRWTHTGSRLKPLSRLARQIEVKFFMR